MLGINLAKLAKFGTLDSLVESEAQKERPKATMIFPD
jgi:hypothetical protein